MATILIVDDSSVIRHLLRMTLRRTAHRLEVVADSSAALARLRETPIDLVITDLHLPDMHGLALLRAIRSQPHLRATKLVVLTSSSDDNDRLQAEEAGAEAFLTKPASSGDIIGIVERLLCAPALTR